MTTMADPAPHVQPSLPSRSRRLLKFFGWAAIFGLAYTQAPLYYSNQNQYFLHGLAQAGHGFLAEDWLANTRDPTPLFSLMVQVVATWFDERVFYALYLLILGAYFQAMLGIAARVFPPLAYGLPKLLLATALILVHSGMVRLISARLTGVDYPWYFQAGVAGQYLLGFGLQPSACGVLLVVSLWAYLGGRPGQAVVWACAAAWLHPTYLLAAGLLVLGYQLDEVRSGKTRDALRHGLGALALVSPIVVYSFVRFRPDSPQSFAESQYLLAHFRIPHHTQPRVWCDTIALAQIGWIAAGLAVVWQHRLLNVTALAAGLSLLLSVVTVISGNDTLALLFPWRTSALLVPLATTLILARLAAGGAGWLTSLSHRGALLLRMMAVGVVAACVAAGLCIMVLRLAFHTSPDEAELLAYVRDHKRRGDVYLLPVEAPKIAAAPRGVPSRNKNFTPPPRRDDKGPHIAVDLQSFRLATGAPIFVDFKSIPYWDRDVLEWKRRLDWALRLYAKQAWDDADLAKVTDEGITHVVVPANRPPPHPKLDLIYQDRAYHLYAVRRQSVATFFLAPST
ncbi:MAG: hypothetical protein NZO58_07415 [Gemmataceae bacterium]|nr:hypothetical protein [Gemmataceae bacterium]